MTLPHDGARTSHRLRAPAMAVVALELAAVVALELAAVELVHRLLPFLCALGQVTLGLTNGMMETHLSPSSRETA